MKKWRKEFDPLLRYPCILNLLKGGGNNFFIKLWKTICFGVKFFKNTLMHPTIAFCTKFICIIFHLKKNLLILQKCINAAFLKCFLNGKSFFLLFFVYFVVVVVVIVEKLENKS